MSGTTNRCFSFPLSKINLKNHYSHWLILLAVMYSLRCGFFLFNIMIVKFIHVLSYKGSLFHCNKNGLLLWLNGHIGINSARVLELFWVAGCIACLIRILHQCCSSYWVQKPWRRYISLSLKFWCSPEGICIDFRERGRERKTSVWGRNEKHPPGASYTCPDWGSNPPLLLLFGTALQPI